MTALTFPYTVFTTQKKMNDRSAADMCCGDLTAAELQKNYFMTDVSEKVDPYTLTELTPFNLPQSRFYHMSGGNSRKKYSSRECADLMFDEMRSLSWPFSVYSPYRQLINKMITHMQYGNGTPFRDAALDMALRNQLLDDKTEQSSLKAMKSVIERNVGYKNHNALNELPFLLSNVISKSVLPKFARREDNFNGLGITVHDIYAIKINLLSLEIAGSSWKVKVSYQAQDHFGLDDKDILKRKFRQFKFFRLWFVLQRYVNFGYKPYFTNMDATIEIKGDVL